MSPSLLQNLLDVGEKMKNALEQGQVDTYLALLDDRGTLLDTLLIYRHPSEVDPNWAEMASALSLQNDALMDIALSQRQRMQDAINRIEQVRDANRSYLQTPGRSNILNENLRV